MFRETDENRTLLSLKKSPGLEQSRSRRQSLGVYGLAVLVEELLRHEASKGLGTHGPVFFVAIDHDGRIGFVGRRVPQFPIGGHIRRQGRLALWLDFGLTGGRRRLLVDLISQFRELNLDERRQCVAFDADFRR